MKTLTLIRHAKSSWDDASLNDFDRPLSKRGKNDAPFMAKILKEQGTHPDIILSSPALRARKTAQVFAKELEFEHAITYNEAIYEANVKTLLQIVTSLDKKLSSVFLVGHNPSLNELAAHFLEFNENIVTCGVVEIAFDCQKWSEINSHNARLLSFSYPKKFRNLLV